MNKFKIGAWSFGALLVVGAIVLIMMITRIPAGSTGIVYSPNGGVKNESLSQGWHLVAPFDKVTKYPVRLQTVSYDQIQVATKDGKAITMDFTYSYQISPDKAIDIFNKFGPVSATDIENNYLRARLRDAARKEISSFTVIDVYGEKSADAGVKVQERFAEDVAGLGYVVSNLTVGVPQPDPKTQEAIDLRVQASQELERKNTELEIAKKEAARKVAESQGVANSKLIEAEAQAQANKLLQQTLTPELVQSQAVQKWDGKMPLVSGDAASIIDLKGVIGTPTGDAEAKPTK